MIEVLTGGSLAAAAGLNAYIPLLAVGLLARFTSVIELPSQWAWLSNEWLLGALAVLLLIEVIADKVPAIDSINDVIQTAVRPAAGGMVFGAGASSETVQVADPTSLSGTWWLPIVVGVGIALGVHLLKAAVRPLANLATAGLAAPVLSTLEDIGAVVLSILAILLPILAAVGAVVLIVLLIRTNRARRRRLAPDQIGAPPPALP